VKPSERSFFGSAGPLGRRIEKTGFGWIDAGAAQMARILLRRIHDPAERAAYWKKRLWLDGKGRIRFRGPRKGFVAALFRFARLQKVRHPAAQPWKNFNQDYHGRGSGYGGFTKWPKLRNDGR